MSVELHHARAGWPYTVDYFKAFRAQLVERCRGFAETFSREHPDSLYTFNDLIIRPTASCTDWIARIDLYLTRDGDPVYISYLLHQHHALHIGGSSSSVPNNHIFNFRMPIIEWLESLKERQRKACQAATATIKEELVATVWAPARVERLLEAGGWEALDAA